MSVIDPGELLARHALAPLAEAARDFRVVVVNGARQSGKTTMLRGLQQSDGGAWVSLDDAGILAAARADPVGFVDRDERMFIDEVQLGGDAKRSGATASPNISKCLARPLTRRVSWWSKARACCRQGDPRRPVRNRGRPAGALRAYIDARVRSGQYGNTSEYLRDLVRRDQEDQAKKRPRELITEGLASGSGRPLDDEIAAELRERALGTST